MVSVAAFGNELVSRAEAKRLTAALQDRDEVELDFSGVEHVGQAFADELVRVWPLAHPGARLKIVNASEAVGKVLKRVMRRSDLPQPAHPVAVA